MGQKSSAATRLSHAPAPRSLNGPPRCDSPSRSAASGLFALTSRWSRRRQASAKGRCAPTVGRHCWSDAMVSGSGQRCGCTRQKLGRLNNSLGLLAAALADRYRVERELGRGGMATVYLAHDLRHDRPVALKVLRPELAASLGPERFLMEIRIAARLRHPHILPVHDSGETAGRLWYTMPYVEGESLRQLLSRERQLPVDRAVRIATQVLGALGYAHGHGVIHRDIKPENILLDSGQAVVADFGVARAISAAGEDRLTETGLALGTPAYMSPEQATASRDLDGRSDLYALGCVLYEMLAGQPPFVGATAQQLLARHAIDPVPPLRTVRDTIPTPVEQSVTRALAKVPADRFATAGEFAEALTRAGDGVVASPASRLRRSTRGKILPLTAALGL